MIFVYIFIILSLYFFFIIRWRLFNRNWIFAFAGLVILSNLFNISSPGEGRNMCLARPKFPVLLPLRGLLGQVFPGHPGTLTRSFSLITFDVANIIKVGYCITPRIKCLHVSHPRVRSLLGYCLEIIKVRE